MRRRLVTFAVVAALTAAAATSWLRDDDLGATAEQARAAQAVSVGTPAEPAPAEPAP